MLFNHSCGIYHFNIYCETKEATKTISRLMLMVSPIANLLIFSRQITSLPSPFFSTQFSSLLTLHQVFLTYRFSFSLTNLHQAFTKIPLDIINSQRIKNHLNHLDKKARTREKKLNGSAKKKNKNQSKLKKIKHYLMVGASPDNSTDFMQKILSLPSKNQPP